VCTGGSCAAPTSAWQTFAYDVQRGGSNKVETGKPPLTALWSALAPVAKRGAVARPVAVDDGRVFVSWGGGFGTTEPIVALDLSDGSQLWTYNFGSIFGVGQPTVIGETVYVQTGKSTTAVDCELYALDAASGATLWSSPFGCQWEDYWAPLVASGRVYIDGGVVGGLYGFNAADGSQLFFNNAIGQYDQWAAAAFAGNVYTYVGGYFRAHDPLLGTTLWTIQLPWNPPSLSVDSAAVFGDTLAYVVSPPNLVAIDPVKQAVAWTANGTYSGMAAYANGVVYGISGGNLIARDALTGTLSWSFTGNEGITYPPVLANGYAYMSNGTNVYAVDLTTHQQVWTAPVGGWLAIASGRLLVAGTDGTVHAFLMH
jgi:outer membrane protein assembly factor BamB